MQGADLSRAKLHGACLSRVRLHGALLQHTQFHGAYLSGASLQGANLGGAKLQGANLSGAQLQGALFLDMDFFEERVDDEQFERQDMLKPIFFTAELQGAGLQGAVLDYSKWDNVEIETDEKKLEKMLNEEGLERDKIERIVKEFKNSGGSQELWEPKSARIFCDTEFYRLIKSWRKEIQKLDLENKNINWQEGWERIFKDIKNPESRYYTAQGLIRNFAFDSIGEKEKDTPCTNGLRSAINKELDAIQELDDYKEIRKRLPPEYQKWLGGQPE